MKIIEVNAKAAVELEEYQGTYKLVACWFSTRDDEWKQQWGKVQIGKEEKKRPVSVYLGNRDTAVRVLKEALAELSGNNRPPAQEEPISIPEDDIPF